MPVAAAYLEKTTMLPSSDDAQGDLVLTSSKLNELIQEPLSDTAIARMARLIEQLQADFMVTVRAWEAEQVS